MTCVYIYIYIYIYMCVVALGRVSLRWMHDAYKTQTLQSLLGEKWRRGSRAGLIRLNPQEAD